MDRVCAVIVTYNRKELLRECLQAVLSQTRPPDHVLVVDNASTDGTREMLKEEFPQVEVLALPENQGGAGGFHEGMKRAYEAGYDWIWVMDDDTIPGESALEKLLEAAACLNQKGRAVNAIGSRVLWTNGKVHPMNSPWSKLRFLPTPCALKEVVWISFVSVLIKREAIFKKGLPKKEFFIWNDDVEYFLRLGNAFLNPSSIVVHKTTAIYTPADSKDGRYYYQVRNRLWIMRSKNLPLFWRFLLFLHFAGEAIVYLIRQGKRGWYTILKGLKDGLKPLPW
ncbi:glycosyltransferase family 2 protein [Thermus caldifontis]|uniref:glycosyltransferase family 2 protein n=1 Tax=Thermus caldifontis TaxID=1930763 RepID=UPI000DF351EF|nr:glycosyltransferase family 2 protein [Thermus caldifontis]